MEIELQNKIEELENKLKLKEEEKITINDNNKK